MLDFKSEEELCKGSRDEWDFDWGVFHAYYSGYSITLNVSGIGKNPPFSETYDFPPRYWVASHFSNGENSSTYYFSDDSEYENKNTIKNKVMPESLVKDVKEHSDDFYKKLDLNVAQYNIEITHRDCGKHIQVCLDENVIGLEETKKKAADLLRQYLIDQASKI